MSDSVKKAFQILQHLSRHPGHNGLAAISKAIGFNKTTAFRYLETLTELHLVSKNESGYALGMALFELGNQVPVKQLVIDRIHPLLAELCAEINETVNLAQLYDDQLLYLDKVESRRSLQMQSRIGSRLPLYCTGLGKAILARLPEERLHTILERIELAPVTTFTVTDRGELLRQVQEIRRTGYAVDSEELEVGLTCVAVPLHLGGIDFYGALSISGPTLRFTPETVQGLAGELQQTAARIVSSFKEIHHE